MKSAILSVGTELLFGQIVNTNTVFLSNQLNLLGIDVLYHHAVGDNPTRLDRLLRNVLSEVDLVITTGGLGPTQDDLTKEVIAEVMGEALELHRPSMDALQEAFHKMGRTMTENNKKQAYLPSNAMRFPNTQGTAPGFSLEKEGKKIICLPGPPREMKAMFEQQVRPYLEALSDDVIYHRMIRTFGIGESQVETQLLSVINGQGDPTIATYAKEGETAIRVASKRKTYEEARQAVEEMIQKIRGEIGSYIYSTEDQELLEVVGEMLLEGSITLSSAESCTGGLFAYQITEIPGISRIFNRGLVTYSNQSKIDELGVLQETLERYGAVSPETAREMAQGLYNKTSSGLCISVTGIAGPEGGTPEKPVGLVFIAALYGGEIYELRVQSRNVNRNWNRNYTVLSMLNFIRQILLNNQ
mgnify:CR=1 FL=1